MASEVIAEGNLVILYGGRESITAVHIKRGSVFSSKWGNFYHDDIIGQPYGARIASRPPKSGKPTKIGYVHALRPSPELFTNGALVHRTQIIYTVDISMITMYLDLRPGSLVIESGTGSGSLSRAIIRTIAPHGKLYTYEFHKVRAEAAAADFVKEGLSNNVLVTCRDVCNEGFGHLIERDYAGRKADAVFLDLPKPWEALRAASDELRENGRICSFSPCIEQVQRTCEVLRELGFLDILTIEVLLRPFEMNTVRLDTRTQLRIPSADSKFSASTEQTKQNKKRNREEFEADNGGEGSDGGDEQDEGEEQAAKDDGDAEKQPNAAERTDEPTSMEVVQEDSTTPQSTAATSQSATPRIVRATWLKPTVDIRGHTSYLTFATKPALLL